MVSEKRTVVVKFPYRYHFRKVDVLYVLNDRIRTCESVLRTRKDTRFESLLKEAIYLRNKIQSSKSAVIDLSEDKIAEKWLVTFRILARKL
jgi:hypothetical protein